MINLSRILHPTDFSDHSEQAFDYACAFAKNFEAELHLIHVLSDPTTVTSPYMTSFLPADFFHELHKQSSKQLAELSNKKSCENITVIQAVVEGVVFKEIIQYSRENNIDMIVMGTHGLSGLMHLIVGSVAENVVRKASCPVLTVRPDSHEFVMP